MRMTSKEPSINEEYKEPQNQDGDSNTSIVSTDTLKKRILARGKAGKHLRMTSKEPSINEECREPQTQDGNTSASITSIDTKKTNPCAL